MVVQSSGMLTSGIVSKRQQKDLRQDLRLDQRQDLYSDLCKNQQSMCHQSQLL
jgi:hypothetical protein